MGDDHRPVCELSRRNHRASIVLVALTSGPALTDCATSPDLNAVYPPMGGGDAGATSVFVVHRGQLVSSHCDASVPNRIAVSEAYPDVA